MIFDNVKKMQLQSRKDKDAIKTALLTTLLGELKTLAINKKVYSLTDEDCIGVIKAFLKGINEMQALVAPGTEKYSSILIEKEVIMSLLPSQLSEEDLTTIIKSLIVSNNYSSKKDTGKIMQSLKATYNGQYDGALASKLISQHLN